MARSLSGRSRQETKSLRILTLRTLPAALLEKDAVGAFLLNKMPRVLQKKSILECHFEANLGAQGMHMPTNSPRSKPMSNGSIEKSKAVAML